MQTIITLPKGLDIEEALDTSEGYFDEQPNDMREVVIDFE